MLMIAFFVTFNSPLVSSLNRLRWIDKWLKDRKRICIYGPESCILLSEHVSSVDITDIFVALTHRGTNLCSEMCSQDGITKSYLDVLVVFLTGGKDRLWFNSDLTQKGSFLFAEDTSIGTWTLAHCDFILRSITIVDSSRVAHPAPSWEFHVPPASSLQPCCSDSSWPCGISTSFPYCRRSTWTSTGFRKIPRWTMLVTDVGWPVSVTDRCFGYMPKMWVFLLL